MWDSLRKGLGAMQRLVEANIWIDCLDPVCRKLLCGRPALFEVNRKTPSNFVFNLPVPADQMLEKLEKAGIQVLKRPEPEFYGHVYRTDIVGNGLPAFYGPRGTRACYPCLGESRMRLLAEIMVGLLLLLFHLVTRGLFRHDQ